MKNIYKISIILILSLNLGYAQSIKRSVINSFGSSSSNGTNYLSETFGQPSNIGTVSDGNNFIRQGFEQPVNNLISISGCTDSLAFNYDVNANTDDGSCIAVSLGCTDSLANNYNPFANIDNETCLYSSYIFGDSLTQFGNDVIKTNDQNFLIAGYNDNGENRDGFLAKINFNNEILWSKNIGGYNSDQFNSIIDDNGYYYMCGSTRSFSSDTVRDVFIVKTDYDGNIIWSKVFGGEGCGGPYCGDAGVKIIKESENQYVVVGNAASVGNNLIDAYIFKFNNNGELLYENTSDSGNGSNFYKCISKSSDGGLLIGGQNKAGTSWEPWLKKVDSNGNLIFTNTYGDASTIGNSAVDLLEKNDSSFLLITNADGTDGLIKIDAFGDTIFNKQFTGIGCIDISFSLDSNSIYILGNYQSDINYLLKIDLEGNLLENSFFENLNSKKIITVENDLFVLSNPTFNTNGMSDISILKVDSNFNNCFSVDVDNFNYQDYEVQITNKNDFYTDNNSQNSIVISDNVSNTLNSCISCIKSDFEYLVNNETIELTNYSTPNISYVWKINDDIFSNEYNSSYEFNLNGIFDICLTSFDSCSSVTYCQTIDLNNCEFSDTSYIEVTACENYTWNGVSYYESGEYSNTFTNINGCDSIHTLHLTINHPDTSYTEVTACESYEWNGETYNESGTYFHSFVSNSEYSMNFNGNNNYVSTANDILNNQQIENGSVSCNINIFDTLSDHSIFSLEGYVEIAIRENNSTIAGDCISQSVILAVSDGTGICNSSDNVVSYPMNNINLNNWINVTITWENTNFIKMYINGLLVDTKTPINSPNIDILNRPITFGIHSSFSQNNYLNGLINNVHLWDVPLSSEQIQNYISCPPKGSEANLLGLWNFEEGQGDTVFDLSGNGNDGIINGATYSTDVPEQSCQLTTINGCDSVAVLNLTITQPDTSYTEVTACESYEWNGQTYTESGIYTQSISSNNEFSMSFDGSNYVSVSDNPSLNWGYNNFSVSALVNKNNSSPWLQSIVTKKESTSGDYVGWNLGLVYNQIRFIPGSGTVNGSWVNNGSINSNFTLNDNQWYYITGVFDGTNSQTHLYVDGILIASEVANYSINPNNSQDLKIGVAFPNGAPSGPEYFYGNIDDVYIWSTALSQSEIQQYMNCPPTGNEEGLVGYWNFEEGEGETVIDLSGNGNDGTINGASFSTDVPEQSCQLSTVNGCDSVAVLNLTINQPYTSFTEVTACESYEWNGQTYTESGEYTNTYTNANGCDSTHTLNLTINSTTFGTDTQVHCDTYTWIDGITYTESNNTATFTLTNSNNCDSIVTLDLIINNSDNTTSSVTACDEFTWDGQTYTESGVYTNTYININGCDSIHTLNLTLNSSTVNIDTQIHCNDYTWIDGVTYSESNNSATYLLTDQYGCDSIVSLDLTISYSGGSIFVSACDSYEWNGDIYTESGTYINSYLSNNGCISNDTLQLNIDICGCTDEFADNYDPNANFENGSCIYCNSFSVLLIDVIDVTEIGGSDGQVLATGQGGSSNYSYNLYNTEGIPQNPFTLYAGTYTIEVIDYETFCIAYLDVEVNEPTLNFECTADGCIESSESENSFSSLEECELECSFIDPCDITPTGLYVDNIIHNRIRFNWLQPEVSPSHYMIRYREVGTNNWTVIAAGPQTPSPFNGTSRTRYFMEPETTYEWNIRARVLNEDGSINCQSDWSETSTYTTLPACANLENLSVSTEATWVTFFADAPDESWGVWQSKGKIREVGLNNYRYVNGDNSGNINGLKGNFTANTDYEWHTKAWCTGNVDVNGNSDPQYHSGWGEFSAFTTEELCDKLPINLSTSTNSANTAVIMSWDSPLSGNPDHYFLEMTNNTSGAVYQWNNIPGADNSKTKFNQSPGDEISWRIRGACGTNGTSWATIFTQPTVYTLGGEKLQSLSLNSLEIYPNPSRDVFNIELSTENTQQIEIRVVNSIGQEIYRERVEVEGVYTEQIDLSSYSKGIYNLTIKTSDGLSNHKLILQ